MNTSSAKIKKIIRRFVRTTDFPVECLSFTPLIEIRGMEEATISGVVRVNEYSIENVVIDVCEFTVRISGSKLTLYSLDRERITVTGVINTVCLAEERKNEIPV